MFPYSFIPYANVGAPSYSSSQEEYLRALAEEQAARQAYAEAVRAQAEARTRAARARRARQEYERGRSSYLPSDSDEEDLGEGYARPRGHQPYLISPEHALIEEQRRREVEQQRRQQALELERARERERIRQLEEEQKRRLLEEERHRRMLLEEELRRQKEAEERQHEEMRRRLQDEYLRRQSLSPLEELLGLRPSRSMQSEPYGHRARTMSPPTARREPSAQSMPRSPSLAAERASPRPPMERTPASPPRTTTPTKRGHSPSPVRRVPPPSPVTPPQPTPSPEQIAAATKIQELWRAHEQRCKALESIERISSTFQKSKAAFSLPATFDYQHGDVSHHVTVPTDCTNMDDVSRMDLEALPRVPKLAYTPTNAPVHAYEEELNRLLTQLDEVQSGGRVELRNRRRELARKIEREAERIEKVKVAVWLDWEAKQKAKEAKEAVPEHMEVEQGAAAPEAVAEMMETEHAPLTVPEVIVTPPAPSQMDVDSGEPTIISIPIVEIPSSKPVDVEVQASPVEEAMATEAEEKEAEKMLTTEELPEHPAESTSPPPLVDTHSEAGESEASLRTPILEHAVLHPVAVHEQSTPAETKDVPMHDVQRPSRPRKTNGLTAQEVASIRPLFNQDWDEVDEWDFF